MKNKNLPFGGDVLTLDMFNRESRSMSALAQRGLCFFSLVGDRAGKRLERITKKEVSDAHP